MAPFIERSLTLSLSGPRSRAYRIDPDPSVGYKVYLRMWSRGAFYYAEYFRELWEVIWYLNDKEDWYNWSRKSKLLLKELLTQDIARDLGLPSEAITLKHSGEDESSTFTSSCVIDGTTFFGEWYTPLGSLFRLRNLVLYRRLDTPDLTTLLSTMPLSKFYHRLTSRDRREVLPLVTRAIFGGSGRYDQEVVKGILEGPSESQE